PLMRLLREDQIPQQQQAGVLSLVAALGSGRELQTVFELALEDELPLDTRAQLFDALAEAALRRKVKPLRMLTEVVALLEDEQQPEPLRAAAARAAGVWKVREASDVLAQLATGMATSPRLRQVALESLLRLDPQQAASICRSIVESDDFPAEVQALAVAAWAELTPQTAAPSAVEVLAGNPEEQAVDQIFAAFLTKRAGPEALQQALAGQRLPADV